MRSPALPYIIPFFSFMVLLAIDGKMGLSPEVEYPLRAALLAVILWIFSRGVIDLRAPGWLGSVGIGILVFAIWIAPDALFPAWRESILFHNWLIAPAPAPSNGYEGLSWFALLCRTLRAVVLVPIIEELFWRAWLMRWLISPQELLGGEFTSIPLGTYSAQAFWLTAVLFGMEHGPYWDVGLLAGILYNWWMIRTRSLGDCIVAHAVTNGILSGYVLYTGKWQYW